MQHSDFTYCPWYPLRSARAFPIKGFENFNYIGFSTVFRNIICKCTCNYCNYIKHQEVIVPDYHSNLQRYLILPLTFLLFDML